jgi:riboflavin kinase/FMN adenylyltransferase
MYMRVINWDAFIASAGSASTEQPLAVSIGVFDGLHRGHQALLGRITGAEGALSTVISFRQNPLKILDPKKFAGDIFTLEQKLEALEALGIGQTGLIDFSPDFSRISGREFVDSLIQRGPLKLLALGSNFRCGYRMDTGVEEIKSWAAAAGIETWIAGAVMEGGLPVSSSRIRQAIASGRIDEAALLLGRPFDAVPKNLQT